MPESSPGAVRDPFQAIADPTRRAMLARLRGGALRAGDIAEGFALSQPALSKHLRILREAGLVRVAESGRERLYSLDPAGLRGVIDWAASFEAFWPARLEALGAHLRRKGDG
ncbi:MAG TPA: metalloregulator ArsR/SmtB family transcription factor [Devosia sp.]|nr:metalloregulator ArsR/SmtB family transcription factor [Devosia sp.]